MSGGSAGIGGPWNCPGPCIERGSTGLPGWKGLGDGARSGGNCGPVFPGVIGGIKDFEPDGLAAGLGAFAGRANGEDFERALAPPAAGFAAACFGFGRCSAVDEPRPALMFSVRTRVSRAD
jgi:hypothetical protein